jgi:hypothetical protein
VFVCVRVCVCVCVCVCITVTAVDEGVQGFDAAIENLGELCVLPCVYHLCCYTVVTLLLHEGHIIVTLWLPPATKKEE